MAGKTPVTTLDSRFSSPDATPTTWATAREHLERAEVYWLTTVRPDGRPHVTPLIAVWLDDALYFTTGPGERKARNLVQNAQVVITTGSNSLTGGLDLVVEGDADNVSDESRLQRLAGAFAAKYGTDIWNFSVRDGAFDSPGGGRALVYEVAPTTAFGFGKGATFSQTRWRFQRSPDTPAAP